MRELMDKNNLGTIAGAEREEMEAFRQVGSFLAILQGAARLRIRQQSEHTGGQHDAA